MEESAGGAAASNLLSSAGIMFPKGANLDTQAKNAGTTFGKIASSEFMGYVGMGMPGLMASAGRWLMGGFEDAGLLEIGGRIGGSVAGSIVGNMLLPGAGGLIGTFIADAFVGKVVESLTFKKKLSLDISELETEEIRKQINQITEEITRLEGGLQVPVYVPPEMIDEEIEQLKQRRVQLQQALEQEEKLDIGIEPTVETTEAITQISRELVPALEQVFETRKLEMPLELAEGTISSSREFSAEQERMQGLLKQTPAIWYAFREATEDAGGTIENQKERFVDLGESMGRWADDNVEFVFKQAKAYIELENELENLRTQYEESSDPEIAQRIQFITQQIQNQGQILLDVIPTLEEYERRQQFSIPSFANYADMTAGQFDNVISRAKNLQEQFGTQLQIPDEAFESQEEWVALVGSNFQEVEGVMKQFVSIAIQEFKDLGSAQEEALDFNVRRLQDVDPSQIGQIQKANRYWLEMLASMQGMSAQEYLDMEGEEFNLILGKQNVWERIYSTNQAMMFALQDIKELEEKQLEGVWNIPSGQTFWVPLQSLFYQQQDQTVYPDLGELVPPTERTAGHTGLTADNTASQLGLTQEELATLNNILAELQGMGYEVPEIEKFTAEGAKAILERYGHPGEMLSAQVQADMPLSRFLREFDFSQTAQGLPLQSIGKEISSALERALSKPMLPTTGLKGYEGVQEGVKEGARSGIMEALKLVGPQSLMPGIYDEEGFDSDAKTKLDRMANAIETQFPYIADLAPTIEAAMQNQPPINIDFKPPEIQGDFKIQNTVLLDGRVIARYVNRILDRALAKTIASTGNDRRTR